MQGPRQVTLDDSNEEIVASKGTSGGHVVMLYHRSDLNPEIEHTIVVRVLADPDRDTCAVDRFV